MLDNLFFASATAPVAAERTDEVPLVGVDFDVVLGADFGAGLTASAEPAVVVGLLAVELEEGTVGFFSAAEDSLRGEICDVDGAREVRLVAAGTGFFLSSAEPMDGAGLCLALEAVGAVALPTGLRVAEVVGGRVGGALRPPVRVEEVAEVLDAVEVVAGRFAAVVEGFLTGVASFLTAFLVSGGEPFSVCVSDSDDLASSLTGVPAERRGVKGLSTSAIVRAEMVQDMRFAEAGEQD